VIIAWGIMIIVWALLGGTAAALGNWWILWYGLAALYGPGLLWEAVKGGLWAVRELRRRAAAYRALEQRIRDELRQVAAEIDQALTLICDPCHGRAGRCSCPRKCGSPRCGAPDTVISAWTPAELAMLRGESGLPS
jgi:hypothetical protein